MTTWLPPALFSLFFFGLWGVFNQMAIAHIDSRSALIYQALGVLIIGVITLSTLHFKPETNIKGFSFALLTGIVYGIGCLFYFVAASKGKLVTVVTLTALYPLVTILIAYLFWQETVTLKQGFGILLALISIILMSL